jgi:hypothetical protein
MQGEKSKDPFPILTSGPFAAQVIPESNKTIGPAHEARLHGLAYRFFGRYKNFSESVKWSSGSCVSRSMCEPAGPKLSESDYNIPRIIDIPRKYIQASREEEYEN